jgi:polyisoprenoid-binding protein YceI
MTSRTTRTTLTSCAAGLVFAVLLSASAAHRPPQAPVTASGREIVLNLDPARSSVHYTVSSSLHTVHGTFGVKRGLLRVDPATGKASGEIVVDAVSGQSGNGSRDKKMHKEVLESDRFGDIVFRPDRVDGTVQPQGTSEAQLHGICVLHGSEHELTARVRAEIGSSGQWKGTAEFSVPYNDWGLKNPGNFMLKVDHSVGIEVEMAGSVRAESAATQP